MSLWLRLPVVVRAVVAGLLAGSIGTLSWATLVEANLRWSSTIPWAAAAMAPILALWWLYFARGRGFPKSTGEARRVAGRANRVPDDLWAPALVAGVLGLWAVLMFQGVLGRLVTLPRQREIDPSQYPAPTLFAWLVMSALVAGVVEETAFRGYIQGGIERRHGIVSAILVNGSLFGLLHFSHPEVGIVLLPYYLAVSAVYGLLTSATNSTYPSMIFHAGGNIFSAFSLFFQGRSEWQLTATPPPTIWTAGVDASFLVTLAMFVAVAIAATLAFAALFNASRAVSPFRTN